MRARAPRQLAGGLGNLRRVGELHAVGVAVAFQRHAHRLEAVLGKLAGEPLGELIKRLHHDL